MSVINILNISLLNNPDIFQSPFKIQIEFECLHALPDGKNLISAIDWKIIYVGSANDEKHDQILDQFSVGPLQPG